MDSLTRKRAGSEIGIDSKYPSLVEFGLYTRGPDIRDMSLAHWHFRTSPIIMMIIREAFEKSPKLRAYNMPPGLWFGSNKTRRNDAVSLWTISETNQLQICTARMDTDLTVMSTTYNDSLSRRPRIHQLIDTILHRCRWQVRPQPYYRALLLLAFFKEYNWSESMRIACDLSCRRSGSRMKEISPTIITEPL